MRYTVRHVTTYDYAQDAAFSQHLLRLTPRETAEQRVLDTRIEISPYADGMAAHHADRIADRNTDPLSGATDMFGNAEHLATVTRPHRSLSITATSTVERRAPEDYMLQTSAPWERVRDLALGHTNLPPAMAAAPFAFPSAMTHADPAIEAYGAESLTPGRPYLAAAAELCSRINRDFEYVPGATQADTLPVASFAARRGVCQDFAHVMLACLRAHRLPARYVSGYLRTLPPPGKPRLEGADASHAWVSVWDPVLDWVDFDPTNDIVPGLDHITLAWGRDFRDVCPVSGLVVGSGAQTLVVGVDVLPDESAGAPATAGGHSNPLSA
ncbi:MAG: transglutaminase family protein [Pseudomonadota bacterium]